MKRLAASLLLLAGCYAGAIRSGGPGALCALPGDCAGALFCGHDDLTWTCTHRCSVDDDCEHGCCRLGAMGFTCSIERCGAVLACE